MHQLIPMLIVLGLLVALILGLLSFGLWAARRSVGKALDSSVAQAVDSTGMVVAGVVVSLLIIGVTVRQLAPETALGTLLGTPLGVIASLLCIWSTATVLLVILRHQRRRRRGF